MFSVPFRSLIFGIITVLIFTTDGTDARVLTRCQAAIELLRAGGISRSFLSNWVCLMESESRLDTQLVTGPHRASSYSYGVFQINSGKWCARGRVGGTCNKRCEDFANDDIQDDIACAKKIFDSEGFGFSNGWMKKCKNKPLPNVSTCRR